MPYPHKIVAVSPPPTPLPSQMIRGERFGRSNLRGEIRGRLRSSLGPVPLVTLVSVGDRGWGAGRGGDIAGGYGTLVCEKRG